MSTAAEDLFHAFRGPQRSPALCLKGAAAEAATQPDSTADDELQQHYLAEFERQYKEQVARMQAQTSLAEETLEAPAQPGRLCSSFAVVQALSFASL